MTPAAPPTPAFPPGRYGRRRDPARQRRRHFITFVLATLVVAAGVLIALKLYRQYAEAPYQVTIVGVSGLTDHSVTVTFDVTVPPGGGATCTVLAHTREGEEVGRALVSVPAADRSTTVVRVAYTLATTKRPVTGEVPGCGP